jgi:hypothetical protein
MTSHGVGAAAQVAAALYNGSCDPLEAGTVLRARPGGYVRTDDPLEAALELHRPPDRIARAMAVFMAGDPDEIDNAGGYTGHTYAVEPRGVVERSDVQWITALQLCIEDGGDEAVVKDICAAYWRGAVCPIGEPVWEFRANSAAVVGELNEELDQADVAVKVAPR